MSDGKFVLPTMKKKSSHPRRLTDCDVFAYHSYESVTAGAPRPKAA
jgi:hypothetical protein